MKDNVITEEYIQSEIDKLIKANDRLRGAKETELNLLKSKLAIGNVINNLDIICSKFKIVNQDNEMFVCVIVHPNLRIDDNVYDENQKTPHINYGCATDLIRFPLSYLPKIKSEPLVDVIKGYRKSFIDKYKSYLNDDKLYSIRFAIEQKEKELNALKEREARLEYLSNNKEECITEVYNDFDSNIENEISRYKIDDLSRYFEHFLDKNGHLKTTSYVHTYGVDK